MRKLRIERARERAGKERRRERYQGKGLDRGVGTPGMKEGRRKGLWQLFPA